MTGSGTVSETVVLEGHIVDSLILPRVLDLVLDAGADYEIVDGSKGDTEVVGRVTSGAPSPTLGKSIGLGYVPKHLDQIGHTIGIRIRTRDIEARIVELPFLRADFSENKKTIR